MYKALTLLIIIVGKLRHRFRGEWMGIVKNSPLSSPMPAHYLREGYRPGIYIECCDCGLAHRFFIEGEELHAWPVRPRGYDYSWRLP